MTGASVPVPVGGSGAALCTLPSGGSVEFAPFSFYTTEFGDPSPLTDKALLAWNDLYNGTPDTNCNPNPAPGVANGSAELITTAAQHAEISARLNCTSATNVCFDLTVSTADFNPSTRHFTLTLLGHKKGDQTDTFNAIGSSQDLALDNNLDDKLVPVCVTDVTGFDQFRLKIDAVGEI